MLDFERGAPSDPEARLAGEILGSLSAWTAEFDLVGLELAYAVFAGLMKHIAREQPLELYLEFLEKEGETLLRDAKQLREIIAEDFRRQRN